jgi:hypothetical protein
MSISAFPQVKIIDHNHNKRRARHSVNDEIELGTDVRGECKQYSDEDPSTERNLEFA